MKILALTVVVAALSGCARYRTSQIDISPERTVQTDVSVMTFWDSKSALANSKAVQTDKSQSASLGSLTQETTTTNLVAELDRIALILKLLRPTP